jgi:hypothetical protein
MSASAAALSAPVVLRYFRDLGSSPPEKGSVYLSCDPAFNRYTRFWLTGPTLDATHNALEILRLVNRDVLPSAKVEARIYALLRERYDAVTGTFAADTLPQSAGIYGLYHAIGLIKTLTGTPSSQPLGLARYSDALRTIGRSPDRGLKRLRVFLQQCAAAAPSGGLVDHPKMSPRIATVTTLHTAVNALWNVLGTEPSQYLADFLPAAEIGGFLSRSLRSKRVGRLSVAAFTIAPTIGELCTNTTFFALETIKHLGLDGLLTADARKAMVRFLLRVAWNKEGGFSSTAGEIPSLNATLFGLRALRALSPTEFNLFVTRNLSRILRFVAACEADGGFAFTSRLDRFLPNPLATRYALQIRKKLREQGFSVPADPAERIAAFVQHDLFDEESGSYCGYPSSRIESSGRLEGEALYSWQDPQTRDIEQGFRLLARAFQQSWGLDKGLRGGLRDAAMSRRRSGPPPRRAKPHGRPLPQIARAQSLGDRG